MLTSIPSTQDPTHRTQLKIWQKLLRMNWFLFVLVLTLSCISVVVIYSATYANESEVFRNTYRMQMIWVVIGFGVYFLMALTDYRLWLRYAYGGFGLMVFLLVAVLLIGKSEYGAKSWIRVGPIGFQPSELCKLAFILFFFGIGEPRAENVSLRAGLCRGPLLVNLQTTGPWVGGSFPADSLFHDVCGGGPKTLSANPDYCGRAHGTVCGLVPVSF